MAVRAAKMVKTEHGYVVVTWEQLEENAGTKDTGAPVVVGPVDGLTVQATGNFDTDAVVQMQGSNNGTDWFSIGSGTLTAAALVRTISERPLYIRPAITVDGAADASDIDIIMVGTRRRF